MANDKLPKALAKALEQATAHAPMQQPHVITGATWLYNHLLEKAPEFDEAAFIEVFCLNHGEPEGYLYKAMLRFAKHHHEQSKAEVAALLSERNAFHAETLADYERQCVELAKERDAALAEVAELKALDKWNNSAAIDEIKHERDRLKRELKQIEDGSLFREVIELRGKCEDLKRELKQIEDGSLFREVIELRGKCEDLKRELAAAEAGGDSHFRQAMLNGEALLAERERTLVLVEALEKVESLQPDDYYMAEAAREALAKYKAGK